MDFFYSFPAIRGFQAKSEFFSIMCPLGLLKKIFTFYNDEIPEEYRAQRIINEKRIPEIRDYILNNTDDYVFSAITASIDGEYEFLKSENNDNVGVLKVSMESFLLINDGQHRKAAIDEAVAVNPSLKDESICVVLFLDHGLVKSQQMFSDLNRHAVNVSSSLSILYNHRDEKIAITKRYLNHHIVLKRFIDLSNKSLAQKSNKLFVLSIFHNSFINTLGEKKEVTEDEVQFAFEYWDELCGEFKEWSNVLNGEITPYHSRQSSIATYGVVLEAIGLLGYSLYRDQPKSWKQYIRKLNEIDWNKSNLENWLYRCITLSGKISKSQRQVKLTCIKIKELLGLKLEKDEYRLEMTFLKEKNYGN